MSLWDRYGGTVLAIAVLIAALVLARWVAQRIWNAAVRRMAVSQLGIASLDRVRVIYKRRTEVPGNFVLRFARWQFANRDGTRNLRRRYNPVVMGLSVLNIGHFTFVSHNPTRIYRLVHEARAAGNPVVLDHLEQGKWEWASRRHGAQLSADTASEIYTRFRDRPTDFEGFCADLFRARGWSVVVSPASRDGGYDLVMTKGNRRLVGECKNFRPGTSVGRPLLQKLAGANVLLEADGTVFITTAGYSPDAKEYARQTGMELIDGNGLALLSQETWSGLTSELPFVPGNYELTVTELRECLPPDMRD
ncbi:restriction endonuclease [Aestuariimicrobium soli]|uniref:restriction endonuclease n=1 Tax=Aestuariimicrobium soli TaxID=2035834 RepID=UPI003EBFB94F